MKTVEGSSPLVSALASSAAVECSADDCSANRVEDSEKAAEKHEIEREKKPSRFRALINLFSERREQRLTRKILNSLNSSQLKDIGLSGSDIDKLYGSRDENRKVWPNWPK